MSVAQDNGSDTFNNLYTNTDTHVIRQTTKTLLIKLVNLFLGGANTTDKKKRFPIVQLRIQRDHHNKDHNEMHIKPSIYRLKTTSDQHRLFKQVHSEVMFNIYIQNFNGGLSVCLSVCLSIYLSIYPSIYLT
jgi:hypothetical protein